MLRAILGLALATAPLQATPHLPDQPLGVAWSPVYGFPPAKPETFVPQAHAIGAGAVRLTLYWSQIQPAPGVTRWDVLDAYLAQIDRPEDATLTIASASPWGTRNHAWVFPSSPAADPARYAAFVRDLVTHVHGRIRYFQAENEPNNAFFWAGSADDYAVEQRIFYRAVKAADPKAIVMLGASDGLFDPSGADPFPGQDKDMAFWGRVLKGTAGAYDLFDLHLYGNPYTIPARVAAVRAMMRAAGGEKPIVASEYSGPSFFEFKANRRQWASLQGPGAGPDSVRALRAKDADLTIETRMFLHPDDADLRRHMLRLQSEDLVVRNLIALSEGIARTHFFELVQDKTDPDAPNTILYGHMALLARSTDGALTALPLAERFRRLAEALRGTRAVTRVTVAAQPDVYAFRVVRRGRPPLLIAWRRPALPGAAAAIAPVTLPVKMGHAMAETIERDPVTLAANAGGVRIDLSEMPVLIAAPDKVRR